MILFGDCLERLKEIPDNSVDLIFTSPPYANQRKGLYSGVEPNKYVEWFIPIADELLRVLKPTGTFILNIKEGVVDGQRHTYVLELIVALQELGFLWTEEFVWHKTTSYPGKWPNRFRDAWERLLQFNKEKKFNMYQEAVMVEPSETTKKRVAQLAKSDMTRRVNPNGTNMGARTANWLGRNKVYPSNVLQVSVNAGNKNHPAVFPEKLPEWFIKLFTVPGDIVLDPFLGSGTTCIVAKRMGREYIGIEAKEEYFELAKTRIEGTNYQEGLY